MKNKIPPINFIGTLVVNVDNEKLSDADFRKMIKATLPIVDQPEEGEKKYWDKEEVINLLVMSLDATATQYPPMRKVMTEQLMGWIEKNV